MANRDVTDDASNTNKTALVVADRIPVIDSETNPDSYKEAQPVDIAALSVAEGTLINGKISVSVTSNNITLSLLTTAGAAPSATDAVWVKINGTHRRIAGSLSVTVNAGTNTFNSGGAELATKAVDYFPCLSWRAASSAVVIGFGRIPYARLYSDFSGTATNEKYGAFSTAPAATDDVCVIGRFEATLSAGAGYTWTVPTFTNANLIQHPIFETRWLTYAPTLSGWSANPTDTSYRYRVVMNTVEVATNETTAGTSNATSKSYTAPFTAKTVTNMTWAGQVVAPVDNGTLGAEGFSQINSAGATITAFRSTAANWTASGSCRVPQLNVRYEI